MRGKLMEIVGLFRGLAVVFLIVLKGFSHPANAAGCDENLSPDQTVDALISIASSWPVELDDLVDFVPLCEDLNWKDVGWPRDLKESGDVWRASFAKSKSTGLGQTTLPLLGCVRYDPSTLASAWSLAESQRAFQRGEVTRQEYMNTLLSGKELNPQEIWASDSIASVSDDAVAVQFCHLSVASDATPQDIKLAFSKRFETVGSDSINAVEEMNSELINSGSFGATGWRDQSTEIDYIAASIEPASQSFPDLVGFVIVSWLKPAGS
mgnify:CR=1 FL=1